MDLVEDKDLMYIAREGLKSTLPEGWKPVKTRDGEIYYFNFETQQSQWEHPCDEHYKKVYKEAKKEQIMNKRDTKSSKMRGRLADALSTQQPNAFSNNDKEIDHNEDKQSVLTVNAHQSQAIKNTQKEIPNSQPLEASFSRDDGSFISTTNKKASDLFTGPLISKSDKLGGALDSDHDQIYSINSDEDDGFGMIGVSNLGAHSESAVDTEQADIEDELKEKLEDFLEEKKIEQEQFEFKLKRELQAKEDELESEFNRSVEVLRTKLRSRLAQSTRKIEHELENSKTNLIHEYEKKYKEKEAKLKAENKEKLQKFERQQEQEMDDDLESHRRRIKEDFDSRKNV